MQYVYHYTTQHLPTGQFDQGLYYSGCKIDNEQARKAMLVDLEEKFNYEPDSFVFINFSYLHSKDEL